MRFEIARTSDSVRDNDDIPPWNGATRATVSETVTTTKRQHERSPFKDEWYTTGYNHREEGDGVPWMKKEMDTRVWVVDLPTYESFMMMVSEVGECVVSETIYNLDGRIEICDEHRDQDF